MAAAFFDGLTLGLLIPLADGILRGKFSGAWHTPVLKNILSLFPNLSVSSYQPVFFIVVTSVFLSAILNYLMRYLSVFSASFILSRSANNLRRAIFAKYLDQGKKFFDKSSFGELNSILHSFTANIAEGGARLVRDLTDMFVLFIYFGMLLALQWKLTLVVVCIVPFADAAFGGIIKLIKKRSFLMAEHVKELGKKGYEVLTNILLVKISASEANEKKYYNDISDNMERISINVAAVGNLIEPLQRIFMLLFFLSAVVLIAFKTKVGGSLEIARMSIYCVILREFSLKLPIFTRTKATIAEIAPYGREVARMLELRDDMAVADGKETFGTLEKEIEIRNLIFSYGEAGEVLKGVSFSVKKGSKTAIVGPTGAGKSTIIMLLLRLYDCPRGSIMIDGKDIRSYKISSLMSKIALVSQDTNLFNDTLKNNIIYGAKDVSDEEIRHAIERARLSNFVTGLPHGIETFIGDKGVRLSGGEKQRIAIARALLKKPDILILDEATSALDSATERLVHEAINEALMGRTSIIIAHRLSTIKKCDKIVVIEDGKILEQGSFEELLNTKGKFCKYWEEQKFY